PDPAGGRPRRHGRCPRGPATRDRTHAAAAAGTRREDCIAPASFARTRPLPATYFEPAFSIVYDRPHRLHCACAFCTHTQVSAHARAGTAGSPITLGIPVHEARSAFL